jgi:(+)-trans-carveol dehydrogenase
MIIMERLDGRVAFVTGVARGQGRSHALRLAEEGADIIGVDLPLDITTTHYPMAVEEDLAETAELIAKTGRRAHLRQADVRDLAALRTVIDSGVVAFGRLDIVVVNAGIFSLGAALDLDEQVWQDIIDVNLTGAWHTVKAATGHIRAGGRGGSIIFTASAAALLPPPGIAHYNAAKAGVNALMKTLAVELGPEYIRVNSVNPGNVDTAMIDNETTRRLFMPELEHPTKQDAEKPDSAYVRVNAIPIPWLESIDISNLVVFLASDRSRYLTGAAIPIDAGYVLKKA